MNKLEIHDLQMKRLKLRELKDLLSYTSRTPEPSRVPFCFLSGVMLAYHLAHHQPTLRNTAPPSARRTAPSAPASHTPRHTVKAVSATQRPPPSLQVQPRGTGMEGRAMGDEASGRHPRCRPHPAPSHARLRKKGSR